MNLDMVRVYAISKIDWIKKHQKKFQEQERETRRDYLDRKVTMLGTNAISSE